MNIIQRPIPIVRIIVQNEAGKVLILRRSNTTHADKSWCLPGGKIDYGDTVTQSVQRELREETQLECVQGRFLFYQDSLPPKAGLMHGINLYFECVVDGELELNDESSDVAWIGPEDIENYPLAFRNDEGLQRYWEGRRATDF